jgi:hypothetical protein
MGERVPDLPLARDLKADLAESRRRRVPLLVLYSLPDCPYCSEVRRTQLLPMLADPVQSQRAILRQIDLDGTHEIVGFDGGRTTPARLAAAAGIRFVPVIAFPGGNGRDLAPPLRGMLLPDFYGWYLEDAISRATAALRAGGAT